MELVHSLHLLLLAGWAGLVLAEAVVELAARDEPARRAAARFHFWIDVLVEIPLLAGVVVTGALLLARVSPPSPLHLLHVAAGLAAVAANSCCVVLVIRRYRRLGRSSDADLLVQARRVRLSAIVGVPFALVAAYVGFAYWFG